MNEAAFNTLVDILKQKIGYDLQVFSYFPITKGNSYDSMVVNTNKGRYILKILKKERDASSIINTVEATRLVAENHLEMPQVVCYEAMSGSIYAPFIIQEFIEGEDFEQVSLCLDEEERIECFYNIGLYLAKLHAIKGKTFSIDLIYSKTYPSWKEFLYDRIEKEFNFLKSSGVAEVSQLNKIREAFYEEVDYLPGNIIPVFVHRDIHPGNAILYKRKFISFIDFEIAWFSDALWDFNKMQVFFFNGFPKLRDALYDGYKLIANWFDDAERRLLLYKGFEYLWAIRSYYSDNDYNKIRFYKQNLLEWVKRVGQ